MKIVLQRVSDAKVTIHNEVKGQIKKGYLILLGVGQNDSQADIDWLCQKIINLRIFLDIDGKMNLSIQDINGEILLISQFTLYASTKKGNRPSFLKSAKPEQAIPLYNSFITTLNNQLNTEIQTGVFGADMKVNLTNDGPVTITIDSKNKT